MKNFDETETTGLICNSRDPEDLKECSFNNQVCTSYTDFILQPGITMQVPSRVPAIGYYGLRSA